MKTKLTKNFPKFAAYACVGDRIDWHKDGFDITARLEFDDCAQPTDYDCYSPDELRKWREDEWFFVGVVLTVSKNGVPLSNHAASVWSIECNFSDTSNEYLAQIAEELEGEAIADAKAQVARIIEALGV